jgi:hypothetical protein
LPEKNPARSKKLHSVCPHQKQQQKINRRGFPAYACGMSLYMVREQST